MKKIINLPASFLLQCLRGYSTSNSHTPFSKASVISSHSSTNSTILKVLLEAVLVVGEKVGFEIDNVVAGAVFVDVDDRTDDVAVDGANEIEVGTAVVFEMNAVEVVVDTVDDETVDGAVVFVRTTVVGTIMMHRTQITITMIAQIFN